MGKKKVAVSLRKPPSVDPQALESFVAGDRDERSIAFASHGLNRVKRVDIAPRAVGDGVDAHVAFVEETPVPSSNVRTVQGVPDDGDRGARGAFKVPANDVAVSAPERASTEPKASAIAGMRTLTLHIPERIAERLEAYCRQHGRDAGSVVADLVGAFLDGKGDPRVTRPAAVVRILARWIRVQIARVLRAAYVPSNA